MANLNKVLLIGRLTRDPEVRTFSNGGKVARFGFAVNNRRKNSQTGQWEDDPVWLDCEAYNRGEFGKLAETVEQYCRKGSQVFIEGHLQLDQWTDRDNQKRQKLKIVVDALQLLDRRQDGPATPAAGRGAASRTTAADVPEVPGDFDEQPEFADDAPDQNIPF
ncbi:MAG: single-stranded DNA-binding protein [Gemmatales bacterium]|nr:single-stranded DNA-binding protein [Gemmatales bacterium]MDW8386332.1 single-stranded DNA-binding protein [Gemmatales bacterium]